MEIFGVIFSVFDFSELIVSDPKIIRSVNLDDQNYFILMKIFKKQHTNQNAHQILQLPSSSKAHN